MSAVTAERVEVLRPRKFGQVLEDFMIAHFDVIFRFLRVVYPIARLPILGAVVTRNDDVREVLLNNADFHVEQAQRLNVLTNNVPFMLGLDDRNAFERSAAPLRQVVREGDIKDLAEKCSQRAAELIADLGGRLEVVDFVRQVTLDVFSEYIGVTQPQDGDTDHDLRIMATRTYEFQITPGKDPALEKEAKRLAEALCRHIDALIAAAQARGPGDDNILGRLLIVQANDRGALSDAEICADLFELLIGSLPQLPIAAPQALDQLLSRPRELAAAATSARCDDDVTLARYVFEALRFDPMASVVLRTCVRTREIASGAFRHTTIKEGDRVAVALLSAMKDPRRMADPEMFDPGRAWATYLHFGFGLHTCLFEHVNGAVLPAVLKPLLARDGLAREQGSRGKLLKRGLFTDQLWVKFTP